MLPRAGPRSETFAAVQYVEVAVEAFPPCGLINLTCLDFCTHVTYYGIGLSRA